MESVTDLCCLVVHLLYLSPPNNNWHITTSAVMFIIILKYKKIQFSNQDEAVRG